MGHDHDHLPSEIRHEKPLWWALGLTTTFLLVEVAGAFWTNSLALLSDAAHMATDTLALMVALVAVRLSRRPPDAKRTYGYARLEAIGAMINGGMLFVVAGYILWEAVQRFRAPQEIASTGMLVIAVFGLVINLISMRLLRAGGTGHGSQKCRGKQRRSNTVNRGKGRHQGILSVPGRGSGRGPAGKGLHRT